MRTKKTEMRFNRATHEPAWQEALPAGHGSSLGQPSTARGARQHERGLVPSWGGCPSKGGRQRHAARMLSGHGAAPLPTTFRERGPGAAVPRLSPPGDTL